MTGMISGHFKLVAAFGMAVTLAGCEDGQGPNFDFLKKKDSADGPAISAEAATPAGEGIEREVEKPDVFSANEPALWDGRPSLGGVWVASPGVKDPERVIIHNLENGKSVVGALFRRERENPGPRLQLSSDAATELGVLAGAPTKLSVVALRTEKTAPATPAPAPAPVPEPEPVAVAAATPTPAPTQKPIQKPNTAIEVAEAAIDDAPESQVIAAADGPRDPLVAEPEPEAAPVSSAMPSFFKRGARGTAATAANGFEAGTEAASTATDAAVGAGVQTAEVGTSTLSPIEAAEAAIARSDKEIAQAPAPVPVAAPAPATPKPSKKFSDLEKPYIQIGIFAVQANADRAGRRLNDAGILPVILKQQSAGRTIWRVIVGPARTKSDGRVLQKKVQGLGYTDAYFVTN